MRRSLAEAYVSLDYCVENHILEVFAKFAQYLIVHLGPAVEHGYHESFDREFRIRTVLHETDGLEQLSESFEGEEFRLYRNYD